MQHYTDQYIGGAWRPADGTDAIDVVNPATEEAIASVPAGTASEVDAAVAAARAAAPDWARSDRRTRLAALTRVRDGLAKARAEAAATITAELGTPTGFADAVQAGAPLAVTDAYLQALASYPFEEQIGTSRVHAEPAGVVAAITPWNYPLHQVVAKVVPALAAGCPVVLKPSEETPLTARLFAGIIDKAGLPPGVFSMVTGHGAVAGAALAAHPEVDAVSFTGSTEVGRRIGEIAGHGIKKVSLELGGKSASVALPDADLTRAVKVTLANVFANSGQTCTAWTRLLVPQDRYEEAVALAAAATAAYAPGDPADPATRVGPLVSARQRDRVRGYITDALAAGADAPAGGAEPPPGLERGYYVRPTVLAGVEPGDPAAQEEIFGPVLVVLPYRDQEHALEIANGTEYGLAGAVWSGDRERAVSFARRMDTGQVDINGGRFNPGAPFGGWKRSGVGRELGRHGLEEFLRTRSLQF